MNTMTLQEARDHLARRAKPNKYRAKKVQADGHTFDSMAEHRRYLELKGKFINLTVHPKYPLIVAKTKPLDGTLRDSDATLVCNYEADFAYYAEGRLVVEDVKGMRSGAAWAHFRTKAKLFRALYGIEVSVWPPIEKKPRKTRRKE